MVFFVYFLQTFFGISPIFLRPWGLMTRSLFTNLRKYVFPLRILSHQITGIHPLHHPESELFMKNLDICVYLSKSTNHHPHPIPRIGPSHWHCGLQIWLHQKKKNPPLSSRKKSRLLTENCVETITVHPKVSVSLLLSRANISYTHTHQFIAKTDTPHCVFCYWTLKRWNQKQL